MQAIGTGVNPENGAIWAEPHQLLSWAEAFPKLQTQAGVPKCNSPSEFYTNHLFCLQIIKHIFSFHGETFSTVYFIFKIPFWFGKVGKKKKNCIPNCAKNTLSLWPDSILSQLCEVHSGKKKVLQNLLPKLSHRRQAS